ncbi:MAG: hypothetical protein FWF46_07895 [Oscillospiraceae bacterium]|nr:hypothetical protein [Oscillospiraceae bacterium]
MLILATVAVRTIIGGGLFSKVNEAKIRYDLSAIQEEITTYVLGQQMDQKSGIDLYPVFPDETMANSGIDTSNLPDDLKQKLLLYASTAPQGKIPTFDDIDYTQFYKIDTSKVQSASGYGDLYLYGDGEGGYKVISLTGITLGSSFANVIIPWNDTPDQYVATSNNTYKLCSDGTLKVVGQLSGISGATQQELDSFNGLQEFVLPSESDSGIAQYTSADHTINSEEDKVKKIYFEGNTVYVIDKNDVLWAWGDNTTNKLGLGNSYIVTTPTKIAENAKDVWAGYNNTWYLGTDGKLYAAGDNTVGTLGQGDEKLYYGFVNVPGINGTVTEVKSSDYYLRQGCIIICDNGSKVYGLGVSYALGLGTWDNQDTPKELPYFEGASEIVYGGTYSLVLKNGTVNAVGINYQGWLGLGNVEYVLDFEPIPISNVVDIASFGGGMDVIKTADGDLYFTGVGKQGTDGVEYDGNPVKVAGETGQYKDMELSNNQLFLMDKMLYSAWNDDSTGNVYIYQYDNTHTNVLDVYKYAHSPKIFKENNKIYIYSSPNITVFGKRTITSLKTLFNGVSFVQGMGSSLNIVTSDGEIYEDLIKNTDISNVEQLISSSGARYVLTKDGKLFAKNVGYGQAVGGWGDATAKGSDTLENYNQVLKTAGTSFDNVKKVFAIKDIDTGWNIPECIFITEDNRIYWMGTDYYVCLPAAISGDVTVEANTKVTLYPKDITDSDPNQNLKSIADKIKDIRFSFEGVGGSQLTSTLIVTDDGELYTMSRDARTTGLGTDKGVPTGFVLLNDGTGNLGDKKILEARICGGTSFVVTADGDVYAWGYNYYGLMGPGYDLGAWYDTPQKLKISNIRTLEIGDGFAIFVGKSGQVWGIGNNAYGQLGDGTTKSTNTFVRCTELEK